MLACVNGVWSSVRYIIMRINKDSRMWLDSDCQMSIESPNLVRTLQLLMKPFILDVSFEICLYAGTNNQYYITYLVINTSNRKLFALYLWQKPSFENQFGQTDQSNWMLQPCGIGNKASCLRQAIWIWRY